MFRSGLLVLMMMLFAHSSHASIEPLKIKLGPAKQSFEYKANRKLISFKTEYPISEATSLFFRLRYQVIERKDNKFVFKNLLILTFQIRL